MKNSMNITLGNINLVIDGQPVQLENIQLNYENEASVQELATSTSFIKDMVNEVKSMIKDAQASAAQYTPAPTTSTTSKTTDENKVATAPKKLNQCWDLPAIWKYMVATIPSGFDKAGIGTYVYTYKDKNDKKRTSIKIAFKEESIDMRVSLDETVANFYLYEDAERSWSNGINPALIDEFINELPVDVKEFIKNFVRKVLNK